MIQSKGLFKFTELSINPESTELTIKGAVTLSGITIKSYSIYDQDSFSEDYSKCGEALLSVDVSDTKPSKIDEVLSLDLNNKMAFVWIEVDDSKPSSASALAALECGEDNPHILGVAVNLYPIYSYGMNYVKQVNRDNCNISKDFINYILQFEALNLALNTGNYKLAADYFSKFFANTNTNITSKGCGCSR